MTITIVAELSTFFSDSEFLTTLSFNKPKYYTRNTINMQLKKNTIKYSFPGMHFKENRMVEVAMQHLLVRILEAIE